MKAFNKIFIQGKAHDLIIVEGDKLSITYASYCVKNGCLYVLPYDDTVITVPPKQYEYISVLTRSGDCSIALDKSSIKDLDFNSDTGNLIINAKVENISFNSCGEVLTNKDSPVREIVQCADWFVEDDERSDQDAI